MSAHPISGITICGNWKMNHGPRAAREYFARLKEVLATPKAGETPVDLGELARLQVVVFVPAVSLQAAFDQVRTLEFPLHLGAQSAHGAASGAFTGEISAPLLAEVGVRWVLIGHSERRQFFGETDQSAGARAAALLKQGVCVVFCVGETRAERDRGETHQVLDRQIRAAETAGVAWNEHVLVAYEPVWAIGTGVSATAEQAQEVHQHLRSRLGAKPALLYGGSVTPDNVASLLTQPDINGVLAGGSSLKPESFAELIRAGAALVVAK